MIENKEEGIKIAENENVAFWEEKRKVSELLVKEMEKDLIEIPKMIDFHKAVVLMCETKKEEFK